MIPLNCFQSQIHDNNFLIINWASPRALSMGMSLNQEIPVFIHSCFHHEFHETEQSKPICLYKHSKQRRGDLLRGKHMHGARRVEIDPIHISNKLQSCFGIETQVLTMINSVIPPLIRKRHWIWQQCS